MNIEEIRARIIRRLENTAPIETPGTWYHEDIPDLLSEIDRLTVELQEAQKQRDKYKHWYEVALEAANDLEDEYEH